MNGITMKRRTALASGIAAAMPGLARAQVQPVTIELYGVASGGWQPVIDAFQQANPAVSVKWSKYGVDDLKQAERVAASSRRMPTLWYNWGGTLQSQFDRPGVALETSDLLRQSGLADRLIPTALDLARDRGQVWGFPYRLIPMSILYRRDVLDSVGASVPRSWAEFEQVAATLVAKGIVPFATGGKFGWMTMRYVDLFLEHSAGPEQHDKLKRLEVSWKTPAVVAAYTTLKTWTDRNYFNKGFLGVDPTAVAPMLYDGHAAMMLDNPGVEASRLVPDKADLAQWATFVAPTDQTPLRASGFITQLQASANATPEQREAVVRFWRFISDPANATKFLPALGGPSAYREVAIPAGLPLSRRWTELLVGGLPLFLPADQAFPQEVVNAYFETNDAVILGQITPTEAAARMEDAAQQYRAQR